MAKRNDIPVHKVRIRNPKTGRMEWTFRVEQIGTMDIGEVCERIGRRLLIDPRMAAMMFEQIAEEIIYRVQYGMAIDMGTLGFMYPAIRGQGISPTEEGMTLHGTRGFMRWEPSKRTKNAFWGVGCTLDWKQRERDRERYRNKRKGSQPPGGNGEGDYYDRYYDPDDGPGNGDDFDDEGYPLDIRE